VRRVTNKLTLQQ